MGTNYAEYPQAGNYIDLSTRTNQTTGGSAALDNGNVYWSVFSPPTVMEFVCDSPHGLRTYDAITSLSNEFAPIPYTLPIDWNTPLTGTVTVTNGSANITFAVAQRGLVGQTLTFAGDTSNGTYTVTSQTGNTALFYVISPVFGGTTSPNLTTTATATRITTTLSGTATVTNGSAAVIFTNPQTITGNQILTFDNSGVAYRVSPATSSSTIAMIFPIYQGATASGVTATEVPGLEWWNQTGLVFVTGPETFVLSNFNTSNAPNFLSANRIASTSAIPISQSSVLAGVTANATRLNFFITTSAPLTNQIQAVWQFLGSPGDSSNGSYTVTACTLSGTASVNVSSTSVTTSVSLTGQIGQTWKFPGSSTVFTVTAGSGTSWTISPALQRLRSTPSTRRSARPAMT